MSCHYVWGQWYKISSSPPGSVSSASKIIERNYYFPKSKFYLQTVKIKLPSSKCLTSLRVQIRECTYGLISISTMHSRQSQQKYFLDQQYKVSRFLNVICSENVW
ncbi:Hypothetical_protein [Hexamita inflata]|uniref:Hypothetical_protein n=1 Tax=Hexamita inflata TaxID=28002 RepID=A0ABP1I9L3_9EUKA